MGWCFLCPDLLCLFFRPPSDCWTSDILSLYFKLFHAFHVKQRVGQNYLFVAGAAVTSVAPSRFVISANLFALLSCSVVITLFWSSDVRASWSPLIAMLCLGATVRAALIQKVKFVIGGIARNTGRFIVHCFACFIGIEIFFQTITWHAYRWKNWKRFLFSHQRWVKTWTPVCQGCPFWSAGLYIENTRPLPSTVSRITPLSGNGISLIEDGWSTMTARRLNFVVSMKTSPTGRQDRPLGSYPVGDFWGL